MSGLAIIKQDDFAAGILRGVAPDVQPGLGVFNSLNGLYDDDGDIYKRGGTGYYSTLPAFQINGLTFLWTGFLSNKAVQLAADKDTMYALDAAKKPVAIGGAGSLPVLPAITANTLFMPNRVAWGGSAKQLYNTGTITVDPATTTVTGAGTAWSANVEAGMLLWDANTPANAKLKDYYRVVSVVDNTHLTLDRKPITTTGAAVAALDYFVSSTMTWTPPASLPAGGTLHLAAIAGRLVVASGNRIAFSEANKPWSFLADDYHDLPQGVLVMGLGTIRDTLQVFTNYGLWSITNLSYNLTDAVGNIQQILSLLAPELSLWHESGLTEWAGRVIAPCIDRVYLIDGMSAPVSLSDSVTPLYMQYIRGGFRPGGTKVFRNTFFLPVVKPDATATPEIMFACRVNRPVKGRLTYYPWTVLTGHAAGAVSLDVALVTQAPMLLAAHKDGRVSNFTDLFAPSRANAYDADGTVAEFDVETRDFPTGSGQPNHVRRVRLRYTLEAADIGLPRIDAGYSTGSRAQDYEAVAKQGTYAQIKAAYANYTALFRGLGWVSGLPPSAGDPDRFWSLMDPEKLTAPGVDPATWWLRPVSRSRYIRARFRISDPVGKLVIHHIDLSVRPATHSR